MFSCPKAARAVVEAAVWVAAGLLASSLAAAQSPSYPGIGRSATAAEIKAWDIDVRPDFKGLPPGSGSVAKGQVVWEAQCASCHGVFGENNEVFTPLVGGTTAKDVKTGRVARLTDPAFPGRTTLMKLATLSTLWDYIHRAMPWNAPKSLSVDDVYAVTAFMLNLGGVVPDDYTLSDRNMAQTQALLPNRNGMHSNHGLWPGRSLGNGGKPDVKATACMNSCATEPTVASFLPDFARNAHGNLAEQNRLVGAQRGVDTSRSASAGPAPALVAPVVSTAAGTATATATGTATAAAQAPAPAGAEVRSKAALALARKHNCLSCHGIDNKVVGPALNDVVKKYAGRADAPSYLSQRILAGGGGVWGPIAMPAQALSSEDAKLIAQWLADGVKK